MSRGSYKQDQKIRNGDGNQIMSDFIHTREFIVYSPLVEPWMILKPFFKSEASKHTLHLLFNQSQYSTLSFTTGKDGPSFYFAFCHETTFPHPFVSYFQNKVDFTTSISVNHQTFGNKWIEYIIMFDKSIETYIKDAKYLCFRTFLVPFPKTATVFVRHSQSRESV